MYKPARGTKRPHVVTGGGGILSIGVVTYHSNINILCQIIIEAAGSRCTRSSSNPFVNIMYLQVVKFLETLQSSRAPNPPVSGTQLFVVLDHTIAIMQCSSETIGSEEGGRLWGGGGFLNT